MNFYKKNSFVKSIIITAVLILSGCGNTDIPVETQTVIIETASEPEEVYSQNIPIQEDNTSYEVKILSAEEEKKAISELYISTPSEQQEPWSYWSLTFKNSNSEYRIMFCELFAIPENEKTRFDVFDAFSGTFLFSYYTANDEPFILFTYSGSFRDFFNNHPYFDGAEILQLHDLRMCVNMFYDMNISYDRNIIESIIKDGENGSAPMLTLDELSRVYVNLIPEDFRVKGENLATAFNNDGYQGG